MREPVRLIIPAWSKRFASKVTSITLPALLAPGNLPELMRLFDVELVIVTETRLFEMFRGAQSFAAVEQICAVRLVSLDDVLTESATDYGVTLTHALFRGFADLGARMIETYLVFLNADFIVCDGSLGHLGKLMQEGRRVIHAPSFRVVSEDVLPQLETLIDTASSTLRLEPRTMVKLALANKHPTVKARTVNQRLCHQSWMDQFYWYVDEDTLVGYQAPVALVAVKPEKVVTSPVLVWDFGFLPEAAPTAHRYFITDSDNFFMIEPQSRNTGREMIRIGWTSDEQVARDLSIWLTKEQRQSAKQLLTFHAADLPADLDEVIAQARAYMAEIDRRLSPTPPSHLDHPLLGRWFREATARQSSRLLSGEQFQPAPAVAAKSEPRGGTLGELACAVRYFYHKIFGAFPEISPFHPLWADTVPISAALPARDRSGENNVLWISSNPTSFRVLGGDHVDLARVLSADVGEAVEQRAPYDACICELSPLELLQIDQLYANVRPLVKDEGKFLAYVAKRGSLFETDELILQNVAFPSIDISQIRFWGNLGTGFLARFFLRLSRLFQTRPIAQFLTLGVTLLFLAPLVRLANARVAKYDSTIYRPTWTSLTVEFTVRPLLSQVSEGAPAASP